MSHLQYFSYPGVGERNKKNFKYSQAVRVGNRIECAGQGGWDRQTGTIPPDIKTEVAQAFANVEANLKHAGGDGWNQVFRVNSYHVPLDEEALGIMVKNFKKYLPNHEPIWTCVGVAALGEKEMRVEIEVSAHVHGVPEVSM